jgi:hypothetical protein
MKPIPYLAPRLHTSYDPNIDPDSLFSGLGMIRIVNDLAESEQMSIYQKFKNFLSLKTTHEVNLTIQDAMRYDELHHHVFNADVYNGYQSLVNEKLREIEIIKKHQKFIIDYATKWGFIDHIQYPYPARHMHRKKDVAHWWGYFTWWDMYDHKKHQNDKDRCLIFGYDIDFNSNFCQLHFKLTKNNLNSNAETAPGLCTAEILEKHGPPSWFLDEVKAWPKMTDQLKEMYQELDLTREDMNFLCDMPEKLVFP